MEIECTIRIGGAAGQGVQSIGNLLTKYFSSSGFHVFTHQDYMSRVRGGHNYYQIRVANHPVAASREKVDILLALNAETVERHRPDLDYSGLIIYDPETVGDKFSGEEFLDIPFKDVIKEAGFESKMTNSMAVGAIIGTLGLHDDILPEVIKSSIKKKEMAQGHIEAARAGIDYVRREAGASALHEPLSPPKEGRKLLLLNGNDGIGLGALLSGCKFYAAYPMTPSTSIMLYLAANAKEYGIVVEQAEDEIAAINMTLGASYAGVRAMTGTSGGGFALMSEGISLAGMTETPIVIVEGQRPGPATGLPTRTEQGDLFFVRFSGHGEFPKVVFAPATPEQAVYLTNKAFHLAEKYQIPVFIQTDQYLADSTWTFVGINTEKLLYQDFRLRGAALTATESYKRYSYSDDGISPLAVPGESTHLVVVDSDEHNEEGHIIEDADTRVKMVHKRYHQKIEQIREEMAPPLYYGDDRAEIILVGYGSTYGVLKEAVDQLTLDNRIAMLHFSEICPFPTTAAFNYMELLQQAQLTICAENNVTGQFAKLLQMETGFACAANINKYDGRPFILDTLIGEINGYIGRL